MHYSRLIRHGDVNVVLRRPLIVGDDITYIGMHHRVYTARGRAATYICATDDCIKQAKQWAYNHQDPSEKFESLVNGVFAYSLDVWNYDPLCVSCHKDRDKHLTKEIVT